MNRDKLNRGDFQLGHRPPANDVSAAEDEAPLGDRASRIWRRISDALRADAAGEIDTTARAGLTDPAHELPFRGELEQQVGRDLSGVRAHSGPNAAAAATQLGADAFTVDGAVVFGAAQPTKELVAHELVHVLQAEHGGAASRATDEAEAEAAGGELAAGGSLDPARLTGSAQGVRKREKSPTRALADLIASMEGIDRQESEDELGLFEGEVADGDTATKHELDLRGGVKHATTRTTITAELADAQRAEVKRTIEEAKLQLTISMMVGAGKAMALRTRATGLDEEAMELLLLDPVLVAGKAEQLQREAANKRATAKAIDEENEARQAMVEKLDRGLADLDVKDALEVANHFAIEDVKLQRSIKVTTKKSLGFNAVEGKLERERGITTTTTDEGGEITTGRSDTSSVGLNKGFGGEHTERRSTEIRDTDGKVVRGEQLEATAHGKLVAGEDGSTGAEGGGKLTKAIDHGSFKSTSTVAFGGGATVNILALPKQTPESVQLYSVVVTLNLAAAASFGLSKEREGTHATSSLGATAAASASGEITHTHILDEDAAASYLESLEQAGEGDEAAADKAPELGMLFKAIQGVSTIDDLAGSVTATVGSADAAAQLGVDESVELTMKVGGSLDLALDATSASKKSSAGLAAGASTEAFRTLKIARVAGKPGQQLVDVTVMFGDKQEQHGALTGAALGVSASVGRELWSSAEHAVTFRLDAEMEDYPDLYQTIVQTSSREEVAGLRASSRFKAHVDAYTDKAESSGSSSLGIAGALGVATEDSWARSSSRAMEDGKHVIEETGSSTGELGFSVGPLELLRREQEAKARFESRGGVSSLDISETTTDGAATTFEMPSWQEFLAAESPVKALEQAVRENRIRLRGFLLDPDDLLVLARRAKEPSLWADAPLHASAGRGGFDAVGSAAWRILGARLASPVVDPMFGVDDIELGREVARGTAVADFMAAVGKGTGLSYLEVPLREWHEVSGVAEDDAGIAYEYPEGIDGERYVELRYELRSIDRELGTMSVGDDGVHPGVDHCIELEVKTATLIDQLETATFSAERTRVEMIDELRSLVTVVSARRRALEHPTAETENTSIEDATAAVHHREESLRLSKRSERTLFAKCDALIDEDRNMFSTTLADDLEPFAGSGGQLEQLYENHVELLRQLRATYRAAQLPEEEWICSVDKHGESREGDIDLDRALDILWAYLEDKPNGLGTVDYDKVSARWHRDYWNV